MASKRTKKSSKEFKILLVTVANYFAESILQPIFPIEEENRLIDKRFVLEFISRRRDFWNNNNNNNNNNKRTLVKRKARSSANNNSSLMNIYPETQFRHHFHMTRKTFEVILQKIAENIVNKHESGRSTILPEKQLMAVIWLLSNRESFRLVSDRFEMAKSTLEACFQRVIRALKNIQTEVISWPSSSSEMDDISEKFSTIAGFPQVIGIIDGIHININAPQNESGIPKKHVHSIILQGVCDCNMRFLDCYVASPQYEESSIFSVSPIFHRIQSNLNKMLPKDSHLLGSRSFPLETWLLVPYDANSILTVQQNNFNNKLIATHAVIIRAFSLLLGRFQRLKLLEMNRADLVPTCILAACILHNFCLTEENPEDFLTEDSYLEMVKSSQPFSEKFVAVLKREYYANKL